MKAQQAAADGRPPVSAVARRRGQLHHRRQSLHQCRRHRRARLWRRARSRARPRSGAARRPRAATRLNKLKKDNTGYDLQEPVHRRRRHARHHHRRGAQAVSGAQDRGDRLRRRAVAAGRARAPRPDAGAHQPRRHQLRIDLPRSPSNSRCATATGCRDPLGTAAPVVRAGAAVVGGTAGSAHAAGRGAGGRAWSRASSATPPIADSLEHRRAFWHLRETLPEAQKPRRRLDQARHLGAGRRGAGIFARGRRRRRGADPRQPAGAVRPSRRRQYPLQRQPAGRRRHHGVSRPLVRDERGRPRAW